jgi:uncharacterized protein
MRKPITNPSKRAIIPVEKPNLKIVKIHDKTFILDTDSMQIEQDDSSTPEKTLLTSPPLCKKPNFDLSVRTGGIKKLVLNLTLSCNLRCEYCFVESYDLPKMPIQYATKAIDMFDRNRVDVSFFGGEPLMCWDLLKASVAYGKHKDEKARFHITSNGVLLDEEKAQYIRDNNISLLISLDGPKHLHDAIRKDANGDGTFDKIISNLNMLRDQGVRPPYIRATFSTTPSYLLERLRFCADLKSQGLISGCSIEPAILSEACQKQQGQYDMKVFEEEFHEAALWYLNRIRIHNPFPFMFFDKFIKRLKESSPKCSECGAGNYYYTVGPKGGIYSCHRQEGTKIGHMESGIDSELAAQWQDNRYYHNPSCVNCWARNWCGGGCRQAAISLTGNIHKRHAIICSFRRLYVKEALWLYSEIKNLKPSS